MDNTEPFDLSDWLSRWDMASVPELNDKLKECEFFFKALSSEVNRNHFRWLVSAFLNAAYSFFESTALTAYFRFTNPESGETYKDHEGLAVLRKHVKVFQSTNNPSFVKTAGLSPLTQELYAFRKRNTHHRSLSIIAAGLNLPEDFQFGDVRGEGTPVVSLCKEVLILIRDVYTELNE